MIPHSNLIIYAVAGRPGAFDNLVGLLQAFINVIVKFSRDVIFSELPDQFSDVALNASANNQILHNGEIL